MTDHHLFQATVFALVNVIAWLLGYIVGANFVSKRKVDVKMCEMRHGDLEKLIDTKFDLLLKEIRRINGGHG